jgi:hypothetical protein
MGEAQRRTTGMPVGIDVLASGALAALAVAKATGGGFVRVNQWANAYVANECIIEDRAGAAASLTVTGPGALSAIPSVREIAALHRLPPRSSHCLRSSGRRADATDANSSPGEVHRWK